jgi:hypothetical protein
LEYPKIASNFTYDGAKLIWHDDKVKNVNYVKDYVNETFLTNFTRLDINQNCVWYLFNEKSKITLPRIAYYHIVFFILSNYVRYEPESIQRIIAEKDELFWLIN